MHIIKFKKKEEKKKEEEKEIRSSNASFERLMEREEERERGGGGREGKRSTNYERTTFSWLKFRRKQVNTSWTPCVH